MKKELFLKNKRFHPIKSHLYQNWRAEYMPVVAGCLVIFRSICNIQEKLLFFAIYVIHKKNYSFSRVVFLFFSVQNCQLFLFKNKLQQ